MWILKKTDNDDIHYLLCGSTLLVSRSEGHIKVRDTSVSKQHASFHLTHEDRNLNSPHVLPTVILSDLRSSNGTYVNTRKISPDQPATLKRADLIRFGKNSFFRLHYEPLVVTCSQISSKEEKIKLKETIKRLGGHLLKEWSSDCSHLIMTDLLLTAKTVYALVSGSFIVTPAFFADTVRSIQMKGPMPNPKNYQPPLKEPSLNPAEVCFHPDPQRKQLFAGKTFHFQSLNTFKTMKDVIISAGGSADMLSRENLDQIYQEGHVVVKKPERERNDQNEQQEIHKRSDELLNEHGLSFIPESDIGLAIVYKSIEKYCNPKFKINGILRPRGSESESTRNVRIYATETQANESLPLPSHPVSCTSIPESGESKKGKSPAASMAAPPTAQQRCENGAAKTDDHIITVQDKENLGKRKWCPGEPSSPLSKRRVFSSSAKGGRNASALTNTELMDTEQDVVDEGASFCPLRSSTQTESPPKGGKRDGTRPKRNRDMPEGEVSPIANFPRSKNVRIASVNPPDADRMEANFAAPSNSTIPKSIPFEPYTLPSINVNELPSLNTTGPDRTLEDDEETVPFLEFSGKSIKKEPLSQPPTKAAQERDPDDFGGLERRKRVQERDPDDFGGLERRKRVQARDPDDFGGLERRKRVQERDLDDFGGLERRKRVQERDPDDFGGLERSKKVQARDPDDFGGLERRKRAREQPRAPEILENKQMPPPWSRNQTRNEFDFLVPMTSRASRRQSQRQEEKLNSDQTNTAKRAKVVDDVTNGGGATTIKRSLSDKGEEPKSREQAPPYNGKDYMSVDIKPIVKVKEENDEESRLSDKLQRSLVVVEFAALVIKPTPPSEVVMGSNGLPNYKRFRKVRHNGTDTVDASIVPPLPRIIGGNELVCSKSLNHPRDAFLASQPQHREELERRDRERERIEEMNRMDDFSSSILPPSYSKRRRRIR